MKEKCEICKYYSEDCSVIVVMNGYDDKEDYTGGCRKKSPILITNGCTGFPPISKNSWRYIVNEDLFKVNAKTIEVFDWEQFEIAKQTLREDFWEQN